MVGCDGCGCDEREREREHKRAQESSACYFFWPAAFGQAGPTMTHPRNLLNLTSK